MIVCTGIIGTFFLLYTVIGFLVVPWYAKHYLGNFAADELQRRLTIMEFHFNPYTLVTEAENIRFSENNGEPIASLERLFINIDINRIFNKTINVTALDLKGARVDLVIDSDGRLNIDTLLADLPQQQSQSGGKPFFNLVLESSRVKQGEVHVTDKSRGDVITSTMRDINLRLSSISTIEREKGQYRVNLNLDHETEMNLQGSISLIPLASDGYFRISNISAGNVSRWLADSLPAHSLSGKVNVSGNYMLVPDTEGKPLVSISGGSGSISGFAASDSRLNMNILIEEISFSDLGYKSTEQEINLPVVVFSKLSLNNGQQRQLASIDNLSLTGLEFSGSGKNLTLADAETGQLKYLSHGDNRSFLNMETLNLQSVSYSHSDKLLGIASISMDTNELFIDTNSDGHYILPDFPGRVQDNNEKSPIIVESEVSRANGYQLKIDQLNLNNSRAGYLDHSLSTAEVEMINLDRAILTGIDVNTGERNTAIRELKLSGADISMSRNQDGTLDLTALISSTEPESKVASKNADDTYDLIVNNLELAGFNILMEDNTREPVLQHRLEGLEMKAGNINTSGDSRIEMSLYTSVNDGGFLALEGWLESGTYLSEFQIALDDINLAAFGAYLQPETRLGLESGRVSIAGKAGYSPDKGFYINNAEAGFANVGIVHAVTELKLFTVDALDSSGINLALEPLDIKISEIKLSSPYANVHINEQQNLNLIEVFKTSENDPSQEDDDDISRQTAMELIVERVDVEHGKMDFTDLSLTPQFSTYIHELNGAVSGLNSDPDRYTSLKLDGRVNEFGITRITGELQPFDISKQSDIKMEFRNIDTHSLSPYAAKFAGRKIKSGSLSLDLNYRINNNKLEGNNAILLESLVLGEKVENPDAMDLPLDMAIALLQDENGKIDIDLPISGDLSNPKFEIEAVIQKAMGNLIGGIVSAPFKFIGSLFGISGEELRVISFEPGSAAITPPEAEQIMTLTKVLIERPALKLTVTGVYDPDLDMTAMARQSLVSTINRKTGKDMTPLNYSSPELQVILDELAGERIDISVLTAMKERFDSKQDDPEDIESTPKDFYEAVFDMLVTQINIDKKVLESLARERIQSIIASIQENEAGVTDRLSAGKEVKITESDNKVVNVTLEAGTIK